MKAYEEMQEPEHGCRGCSEMADPPCRICKAAFEKEHEEHTASFFAHDADLESGRYDP